MDHSSNANSLARHSTLSYGEFARRYLRPLRPVIVEGAMAGSPAFGKWTPRFFAERYGSRSIAIDGREYRMADFIDLVEQSPADRPAPYFRNVGIETWAPELMADILPLPRYVRPNWLDSRLFPDGRSLSSIELYIGSAGATFPVLHYDNLHTNAYLMQLHGAKEYLLYAPDQAEFLYPRDGIERNKSAIGDVERPDLDRFPLFARATGMRCVLNAGELLFVPAGWWHTARILQPSVTVSVNTVNGANWKPFLCDYLASASRRRSRNATQLLALYLRMFGRVADLVG